MASVVASWRPAKTLPSMERAAIPAMTEARPAEASSEPMANWTLGKVMMALTSPAMTMMTWATRRMIWLWVVTRLARPWFPPACAPLTTVDSMALAKATTSQVTAKMRAMVTPRSMTTIVVESLLVCRSPVRASWVPRKAPVMAPTAKAGRRPKSTISRYRRRRLPMNVRTATTTKAMTRPMTTPTPACQAMVTRSLVVLVTALTVSSTLTSGTPVGVGVVEALALGSALGVAGGVVAATSMKPP